MTFMTFMTTIKLFFVKKLHIFFEKVQISQTYLLFLQTVSVNT